MTFSRTEFAQAESTARSHRTAAEIENVCAELGLLCKCVKEEIAPQLYTYHMNLNRLSDITKVNRIIHALSAWEHTTVRNVKSNTAHFAFEFDAEQRQFVDFADILFDRRTFDQREDKYLPISLGIDTSGNPLTIDLDSAPHVLIAGTTGSGKSSLLNTIICSMLCGIPSDNYGLVMIDPKQVELSRYDGIEQLVVPISTSPTDSVKRLKTLSIFMDERYKEMAQKGYRDYKQAGMLPLVICVDELADLMLTSREEVEPYIVRIAQKGRAAGLHLILCTQRPTVNVVTGLIKANIPTRIALTCASVRDSMTILDHKGAEMLTGMGDAILKRANSTTETRFQSAYCRESDIETVVNKWKTKRSRP